MPARNAISRRIDRLSDQWNAFATNPDARLLRWLIRDDELRMIETFIQYEQDERSAEIPDLFLQLAEPFEDPHSYGRVLVDSLIEQYGAAREDLDEAGLAADWMPPPEDGQHSIVTFVQTVTSLQQHYADMMEKLALVLSPQSVSDAAQWHYWLHAVADRLPDEVRIAVMDPIDAPLLDSLAAALPDRMVTTPADLDMPAAIAELARSGGTAGPDGQFRVQFTALSQALARSDLTAASASADGALAVAHEHGWPHLVAAVQLAMASGFLSAQRHADAITLYSQVAATTRQLEGDDAPLGARLRVQAGFGIAAAQIAARDHGAAAATYESVAPEAENAGDAIMLLECWRMAAYCHEQARDHGRAWECGVRALDTAESLPQENRVQSTLPFAGDAMLRIAGRSATHTQYVNDRLARLTGTADWRALASAATGTS